MSIQHVADVLTGLKNQQRLSARSPMMRRSAKHHQRPHTYDPYLSPPDFTLAKNHGKAKRVYLAKNMETIHDEHQEICPCCGLFVEGELIPVSAALSKLYYLGSGYALYFKFIKLSIALLTCIFLISGFYNLVSNSVGNACISDFPDTNDTIPYCDQDYMGKYSISNKSNHPDALKAQLILNFITVIVIILFFHYIRYELRKMSEEADDMTVSPSDYTIRISGIHNHVKTKEIKHWVEHFATEEQPIKVRKITRSYDIVEYVQLTKERDTMIAKKDSETIPEIKMMLESQIDAVNRKIVDARKKNLEYARVAYVTLDTAQQADFVIRKAHKTLLGRGVNRFKDMFKKKKDTLDSHKTKVKRAPEPSDILWENLGFSEKQRRKRKSLTTLLTVLFVILSFALVFLLSWAQDYIANQRGERSIFIQALSMGASIFIVTINYILGQLIRKLAEYEKHGTYTGYFTGIARKLSIAQFVNTAFTILFAKLIVTTDLVVGNEVMHDEPNFYGHAGLLEGIFYVFISNTVLTPLMTYFDPFYFLKLVQRWQVLKYPHDNKINQKDAHDLFEGMPIDMSYKFALLMKTMLLTFFYAPAIPMAFLLTIFGLVMVYWTDKYVLLRRTALPFALGNNLTNTMVEYLEWVALMFSLGNVVFVYTLLNPETKELAFSSDLFWLVWLPVVLSLLHIFLPMELINRRLFPTIDEVTETETYYQVRLEFITDYDIENPITREKALIELEKALKEGSGGIREAEKNAGDFEDEEAQLLCDSDHEDEEEQDGKAVEERKSMMFSSLDSYAHTATRNPCDAAHKNCFHHT